MFYLIKTYFFQKRFTFILFLLWIFVYNINSQVITENQIKAGFIYNFTKYVYWPNEKLTDTFRIGIYGDDTSLVRILRSMEKFNAKNKPIHIYPFSSLSEISYTQMLVVTNNRNYFAREIFEMVRDTCTLLITDRFEYQRYVMINFLYNENSKIQFEINSKNINESKLTTSPKLVLLGGSEIDVRKLYLETEQNLKSEKEKKETIEKELAVRKNEIEIMRNNLSQLYQEIQDNKREIDTLQRRISRQKNELITLQDQTNIQQQNLDAKNKILNIQKKEIADQELRLKEQQDAIFKSQQKVTDYSRVLVRQKIEINERQKILNNQLSRIRTQQTFLYLLLSLSIMTIAFIFVIYRHYTIKRKKNLELERVNLELNNKKDQILKQAEQLEIKNIELEKLSLVASKTANAVMIMNETGEFEWINEGFTRLYGYNLEEFIKIRGNCVSKVSTYEHINSVMENIALKKQTITYEAPNTNSDGENIWIHTTLTPILDENGDIKKLIAIDSEITQLKEAELDIKKKNEEIRRQSNELIDQAEHLLNLNFELEIKKNNLEEALQKLKNAQSQLVESEKMVILGQLTAGIAHEINNPVSFINSGVEGIKMAMDQLIMLLNEYDSVNDKNAKIKIKEIQELKNKIGYTTLITDIEDLTKDVKTGINRTVEIIKELRTFSRLDENDLKFIDLHKNIDSTLVILRNKYINRIEIVKKYGDLPLIECYPGKINQVFLNIIVNAIQAIKDEGAIYIETELITKNKKKYALVSIKDTGTGMTTEVKNKIFEPFYTTKVAGEGTGLGLSITSSIIESHQGYIEVESVYGKGTTFLIYLPLEFSKKDKNSYNI